MAASLRDIRRKIKSIGGTKKLTQAMQMVAASKMQKAIKTAELTRNYSRLAWEIIQNIKKRGFSIEHPLLTAKESKNIVAILITSNRGLCGGLNTQIIKNFSLYIKSKQTSNNIKIITMGNKGKQFVSRYYKDMFLADFPIHDNICEFSDITSLAKIVLDDFTGNKLDHVEIFYNHFVSTLKQKPSEKQLLPIPDIDILKDISKSNTETGQKQVFEEYIFEPDIKSILDTILPEIIKIQLHQILLESVASEHSARMIAMKNATDNATDLIDDLSLTYNTLRQAAITREITEISAGAEALKI